MARRSGNAVVPQLLRGHSRSKKKPTPGLEFTPHIDDLLEASPGEIAKKDIALLNLLCAPNLPGSEKFDIRGCLSRLDYVANYIKESTQRCFYQFRGDPDYGDCEPKWRHGPARLAP